VVTRPTSPKRGCVLGSASNAWRRDPLATGAGVMALGWPRAHVAAPHTDGGSTARAMARAERRATGFCARETSLAPQASCLNGGAARVRAPVRCRCGCGAAHRHHPYRSPAGSARAQASTHTPRVGAPGRWAHARASTPEGPQGSARWPGSPIGTPGGRRLASAPPVPLETAVEIAHPVSCHPSLDGAGPLRRQDRQGLARAVWFRSAGQRCWARRMVAAAASRRVGEGPRAIRMAARRAGGALTVTRRGRGAWDQAAVGHHRLAPRDAGALLPLVEPHHPQPLAEAGDRLAPGSGLCVRRRGRRHDRPCDLAASRVIEVTQGAVDCHTRGRGRMGTPRGDSVAGRCGGALLPKRRPVVLPVGLRPVGQACRTLTRQRPAAPEQLTSRPPRLGRDIGLGAPPTAPPHGDFLGLARVVVGVAPMDGLPRAGRPQHPGHAVASAAVGQPGPRSSGLRRRRPDPSGRARWS